MTVGAIKNQEVHVGGYEGLGAFDGGVSGTNSSAHAKASERVLGGRRVFDHFLDVFNGD